MDPRPHTFRHESAVAQVIAVDIKGDPTGALGKEETFILIEGLWYPESSIKAAAIAFRPEQIQLKYDA